MATMTTARTVVKHPVHHTPIPLRVQRESQPRSIRVSEALIPHTQNEVKTTKLPLFWKSETVCELGASESDRWRGVRNPRWVIIVSALLVAGAVGFVTVRGWLISFTPPVSKAQVPPSAPTSALSFASNYASTYLPRILLPPSSSSKSPIAHAGILKHSFSRTTLLFLPIVNRFAQFISLLRQGYEFICDAVLFTVLGMTSCVYVIGIGLYLLGTMRAWEVKLVEVRSRKAESLAGAVSSENNGEQNRNYRERKRERRRADTKGSLSSSASASEGVSGRERGSGGRRRRTSSRSERDKTPR